MAKRKVSSKQLAHSIGITEANLSLLKREKVKGGGRFETLGAICKILDCQPGDILAYLEPINIKLAYPKILYQLLKR